MGASSMTTQCPECKESGGTHLSRCLYEHPPLNVTLEYLKAQDSEFEEAHACNCDQCVTKRDTDRAPAAERWPTLSAIGLAEALDKVEAVAASNQGKHPGRKWVTKSISHHDAKTIKHLGTVQCGQQLDAETGIHGRAHAALRLLMALGLELMRGR